MTDPVPEATRPHVTPLLVTVQVTVPAERLASFYRIVADWLETDDPAEVKTRH